MDEKCGSWMAVSLVCYHNVAGDPTALKQTIVTGWLVN